MFDGRNMPCSRTCTSHIPLRYLCVHPMYPSNSLLQDLYIPCTPLVPLTLLALALATVPPQSLLKLLTQPLYPHNRSLLQPLIQPLYSHNPCPCTSHSYCTPTNPVPAPHTVTVPPQSLTVSPQSPAAPGPNAAMLYPYNFCSIASHSHRALTIG